MMSKNYKNLVAAIMLQATRDYFHKKTTPEKRQRILKDLRSKWMRDLTDGTSVNIAEQLEKHPKEIRSRLRKMPEEE